MNPTSLLPRTASVVIPTCNEGEMLDMTVRSILASDNLIPTEVVIVDDGSTDGSCDRYRGGACAAVRVVDGGGLGVARARNRGAEHSGGEMIVFLDAHCEVSPHWLDHLASAMAEPDVAIVSPAFTRLGETYPVGLGMGWASCRLDLCWFMPSDEVDCPYEIPLAPGGCQAFPAGTFRALNHFDEGFARWGSEDIEISLRAWLLGYRVIAEPKARVAHWFRDTRGFDVDEVDVVFNLFRMIRLHFTEPRLTKVVDAVSLSATPLMARVQQMLAASDVEDVREELLAVRERDDGWFCSTFFPGLFDT
jgi:GT2 family glycosyltransferase